MAQELVGQLDTAGPPALPLVFRQFVFSQLDMERALVDRQAQQLGAAQVRDDQRVLPRDVVRALVEFLSLLVLL